MLCLWQIPGHCLDLVVHHSLLTQENVRVIVMVNGNKQEEHVTNLPFAKQDLSMKIATATGTVS